MISSEESNKGGSSPLVAESSLEMTENTFKPAKTTKKRYIILRIGQSASRIVRRSVGRRMASSNGQDQIWVIVEWVIRGLNRSHRFAKIERGDQMEKDESKPLIAQ